MSYKRHGETEEDISPFCMPSLNERTDDKDSGLSLSQRAEDIEREAYEKGFSAGEKAGFSMGEQKLIVLIEKLDAIVRELIELRKKMIRELEPQVVCLAVSIARKILGKELSDDPDRIAGMAKEALMRLERTGQITIKINPTLYDLFEKHKPDLLNVHPDIVFDVDPSVSPYGSVVMGPVEDVVTDVDEQIRNLIKDMGEMLSSD